VKTGLRLVIGSWKMKPTSRPRTLRSPLGVAFRRSRPDSSTSPSRTSAGGDGRSPRSDIIVTDLPDPDSPTTPSNSPGFRLKLTEFTA